MRHILLPALLAFLFSSLATAATPASWSLTTRPITAGTYWVEGGVGNAGFVVGDSGVVVIDTTVSPASAELLLKEIARITPKPVVGVILTHGDMDHVGGLAAFPAGIPIIAHSLTRKRMEAAVAAGDSQVPKDHLPNRIIDAHESISLGGARLELHHWAPAHTDGDVIVHVPAAKTVFTGDIFALNRPRALIHRQQQGRSEGWITTVHGIFGLDATQFVVGDPPPDFKPAPGSPRFPPFSQVVYEELTQKP